ncbi:unnamed protein product [Heligmosomoides polygyrus]|uniref:DUF1559 domain-containing protein n=1 Tax=Heligmosomoides polygyrus TaxID=6339 RepID=A0A183GQK1_HELPZ|nr:unnamed protein product [Heligmosomoides polygyrus]
MDQYLWLGDRTAQFDRYQRDPMGCRAQMAHVFSMACSALAVMKNAEDDRDSHWLHGQIPSLRAFPLPIAGPTFTGTPFVGQPFTGPFLLDHHPSPLPLLVAKGLSGFTRRATTYTGNTLSESGQAFRDISDTSSKPRHLMNDVGDMCS